MGATFRRCPTWVRTRGARNAVEACGMYLLDGSWFDCQICGGSGWIGVALDELLSGITPENCHGEIWTGPRVGRELI